MSQIQLLTVKKFNQHAASRPLLARDADSMYWMSRYIERAEHVSRLLLVNSNLLVDVGDLSPALQEKQWNSVLTIMRSGAPAAGGFADVHSDGGEADRDAGRIDAGGAARGEFGGEQFAGRGE